MAWIYNPFTKKLDHTVAGTGSVNKSGVPIANDVAVFTDADTIKGLAKAAFKNLLGINPTKTLLVSPAGAGYTTIQAALDDNTSGGELFIVYPGTYADDTINFTAADQYVVGAGLTAEAVVTNTVQIIDYGAFTGCHLNNIKIVATYTAAIDMITGSGVLIARDTHLETNSSGTIAGSPAVVNTTGTFKQVRGTLKYNNAAISGGQIKRAITLGAGAEVELRRVTVDLDGSNASTAITIGYGVGTGLLDLYHCDVDVKDLDSGIVNGLAYLGGSGSYEYMGNKIRIECGGLGKVAHAFLLSSATSLAVRCMFCHLHVIDNGGSSYPFSVGANCKITSQFNDVIAGDDWIGAGTVVLASSLADGEFSLSSKLYSDIVQEYTAGAGVTIDGVLLKDGSVGVTGTRVAKGWFADLEVTHDITISGTALAAIYQPLDDALTNLSGLVYASPSFIKFTAEDTYVVRTLAQTVSDLSGAAQVCKKTNVADANYGTSALTTDSIVAWTSLSAARTATISTEDEDSGTATLPRVMTFKDQTGSAASYNITISLESGGNIDGASTYVLNKPHQSVTIYLDGTNAFTVGGN